jgi:hypothetical protein
MPRGLIKNQNHAPSLPQITKSTPRCRLRSHELVPTVLISTVDLRAHRLGPNAIVGCARMSEFDRERRSVTFTTLIPSGPPTACSSTRAFIAVDGWAVPAGSLCGISDMVRDSRFVTIIVDCSSRPPRVTRQLDVQHLVDPGPLSCRFQRGSIRP